MRVCRACTTSTDESGRFCPACGLELVDAAAETAVLTTDRPAQTSAEALVGATIDGFRIEGILGGGAFGTVYRARQVGLDRPVALKVPTMEIAADPVMAKRFAREARAAARITHPGVVAIYAVGELPDGRPYLAMQLIDGEPLDRILASGPIPATRALHIVRDIASALSETHAADVVHRDLKPTNIMWRRDRNGDDRVTLVDFGIAVAKPGNADATRLTSGGLIGTPHYMSPEQAHGEVVDARADLYALGCILFELVTGKPPFEGSGFEVLLAHLGRPAPAPSEIDPDVPEVIDRMVAHLLAKKPDGRPQSADELVKQIDDALGQLEGRIATHASAPKAPRAKRPSAAPTRLDRPAARPPRRGRQLAMIAGTAVLVAAAGVIAFRLGRDYAAGAAPAGPVAARPDAAVAVPDDDRRPGAPPGTRQVVTDDGEMTSRATLEDPIVAGARVTTQIEVWNAIGAPLDVPHLVVTIEDPDGDATGVTATRPTKAPGRFAFTHVYAKPGRYVLRVFPPEAASVFTIELDVSR